MYPNGTAEEFANCYDPSWGRFRERTRPAPGNHDYNTLSATAYFDYFGKLAGERGNGYYACEAGTWRVYALNSECSIIGGCRDGSAQYEWLERDLQDNRHRCVIAYWHRPRFSSGYHGPSSAMAAINSLLYDHGADVVLAGHDHSYERFVRLDPQGNRDTERGIRHFVVGTGGTSLYAFPGDPPPETAVRNNTTHGVLRLDLKPGSYSWEFLPTIAGRFTDSGSGSCH